MAEIAGDDSPSLAGGETGVHSLDHFLVAVPDLAGATQFYRDFGLGVQESPAAIHLHGAGDPHRWGSVIEGPRKRLCHVSFGAYADDMTVYGARLDRLGVERLRPPPGSESNGLWFRDPDGLLLEIKVAPKSAPDAKSPVSNPSSPAGVRGTVARSAAPRVHPRRLAHILVFASDIPRTIRFYQTVLGLRLSDEAGGTIAFMHGIHGSDHHLIAFAKSNGSGLHHISWDVGSVQEIGLGAMYMAEQGFSAGWGLGRHVLGSNYFHYVRDPWGSWCEYSCDIDFIPKEMTWRGQSHPPEDAFYLWGPLPPADFAHNPEID